MPLLEVNDLRVGFTMYRTFYRRATGWAVDGLDACAEAGQILGVVGASGSGKSLLAHAIMGLLPYNARVGGTVSYDGQPLTPERTRALRGSEFALIPQSISYLDPLMRVRRQLLTSAEPSADELDEIAERFELSRADLDKFPFQLSGGMARRVLLATAMLSSARLIIADEPTPGLSVDLAERMLADFRAMADEGRCLIVISHDVDLISAVSDRVLILNRGRMIAEMPAREFMDPDHYDNGRYAAGLWRALPQHDFDGADLSLAEGTDAGGEEAGHAEG
ncbi:ATP-binding cassette domain-containing protein [Propionibacterium australiense]|uniref:Nickel import system ATP-binding protein NikD n=1 Tax=Propionibacterium australiense TaxID=119981 RepID=A0A383S3K2_9ACTN|nr:ATP-binding cassette domain-containing protein [Propionibacterium australiense]RLP12568.1 ATP-binding cassette domain-containing protein [Propionibacterium australiense]SYZ32608.1 ABC transporter [Propionibacterium australiense]VEH91641.1 Glutathione import ATP-binding protein GsiA [Propionibacterium australiense]